VGSGGADRRRPRGRPAQAILVDSENPESTTAGVQPDHHFSSLLDAARQLCQATPQESAT